MGHVARAVSAGIISGDEVVTNPNEASVTEALPNNDVQATAYGVRCAPA